MLLSRLFKIFSLKTYFLKVIRSFSHSKICYVTYLIKQDNRSWMFSLTSVLMPNIKINFCQRETSQFNQVSHLSQQYSLLRMHVATVEKKKLYTFFYVSESFKWNGQLITIWNVLLSIQNGLHYSITSRSDGIYGIWWFFLNNKLQSILTECNRKSEIILIGHFDINVVDKSKEKQLKVLANKFDFTQIITGPTRMSKWAGNCLDLLFSGALW